jgi:hypothetical protein
VPKPHRLECHRHIDILDDPSIAATAEDETIYQQKTEMLPPLAFRAIGWYRHKLRTDNQLDSHHPINLDAPNRCDSRNESDNAINQQKTTDQPTAIDRTTAT